MSKAFASTDDFQDKKVTFSNLGGGAFAYTAEGDPNTGIVIGDDGVMARILCSQRARIGD